MTPASVTETNHSQVCKNLYGKQNNKKVNKPNYRLNDTVRISKEKLLFEKGYEQNWTREIFTIHQIIRRNPIVYKLKDLAGEVIRGTFYEQELQKVMHSGYYPIEKILKTREKNGSIFSKRLWHRRLVQKTVFRTALPFLTRGAKSVGKEVLKTGTQIVNDLLEGQNLEDAAKRRAKETGRKLAREAIKKADDMLDQGKKL
ncbi:chromo domain-containing protein [Trichonephila clavipes]|nr:chromo domain-containing protein [Trichonephila clavipes]